MTNPSRHAAAVSKSYEEVLEVQSHHPPPWDSKKGSFTTTDVIGHRGSIYEHVENTLEGFQRCANLQCSVELDIYELLQDGTLVVFHGGGSDLNPGLLHPQIVQQNTTDEKSIMDCRLEEIDSLQFNSNYEGYVCPKEVIDRAKIPTLRSVLETLQAFPKTHLKLELKAGGPNLVRSAIQLVEKFHLADRCTFSSFNHSLLHEIQTIPRPHNNNNNNHTYHHYRTGALFDAPVPENFITLAKGCDEIHLRYDTCSRSRVTESQNCGFSIAAWFRGPAAMARDLSLRWDNVREEDLYRTLLQTGVQQICCNKPWALLEMMP